MSSPKIPRRLDGSRLSGGWRMLANSSILWQNPGRHEPEPAWVRGEPGSPSMKAILLSFDDQLEVANLVVEGYNRLWPACPLTFRIPFTDRDARAIVRAVNVELVHTERPIRDTMTALLAGVGDDEFVFWCIDDRYPKQIVDLPAVDAVYRAAAATAIPADVLRLTALNPMGQAQAVLDEREPLTIG